MIAIPESHRDLLESQIAVLATNGVDGRPQVSAVWFLAEGDELRISLNTTRRKVRNLQRDPRCTVLLLDLVNPYRYLEVRGDARLEPDDDYEFAGRLGAKYQADVKAMDPPDQTRVVATLEPVRVNAVDLSA